ncbi:hypothetical protein CLI64_03225 [Nostoc sp. CENA543]|uniref:hypothetical protein n=1 Tax=Nostoc sp. CENA543 TaxID=1869241 RepID=UPI000CA3937C|nr:hypothetical protein [Nostoc sp. CENA543]AUS99479.1 hypothetical protein CLI64_03225 [Nostoc sp. CENA543]
MKKYIWKNTFAGIILTVAAVSCGYLAVQYLGRYTMLAIGAGMFGLGAAVHRTQQSPHQKSLPKNFDVTKHQVELQASEETTKNMYAVSTNHSPTSANHHSVTDASRFVKPKLTTARKLRISQSGYCRKRLALCHRAKVESLTKVISQDKLR